VSIFGVDRRQYRLLVRLFRDLSDRREMTGQLALDRAALGYLGLWLVVIGGLFSVMAVGGPTPRFFLGVCAPILAIRSPSFIRRFPGASALMNGRDCEAAKRAWRSARARPFSRRSGTCA